MGTWSYYSLLLSAGLAVGPAWAATQGVLGTTSSGSADISLTIQELFRISELQDLSLGTWSGSGSLSSNYNLCLYHNSSGGYQVVATAGGSFAVQNGANSVPYRVFLNDSPTPTGGVELTYGTPQSLSNANTSSVDCSSGGLSGNLRVEVDEAALLAAQPGNYTGTLTLVIQPD